MTDISAGTITASIVGREVGPIRHAVDARWLMAYAAALGETDARYYDTASPGGPVAHPVFAVCYEWPAALAVRAAAIDDDVAPFGVHATHHLTIHRPPRPGDVLSTTARVIGVESRRAGTFVLVRFLTVDDAGAPVTTTDHGTFYRGVRTDAGGTSSAGARVPGDGPTPQWQDPVDVPPFAAHVYTECARIWNPIHTDLAVARRAGLPGLILHGTATLALAVSRVVERDLGGHAEAVRIVRARFSGMVALPSRLLVRGFGSGGSVVPFDVVTEAGRSVLDEGAIERR